MKILIFNLDGDYAHFRKFYTTSSPLTFSFPPRTAIQGIIGAILGYSKDNYIEKLMDTDISISLNKSVKKMRIPLNLIDTKAAPAVSFGKLKAYHLGLQPKRGHTRIRFELIKDPSYRIYFFHSDIDIMRKLLEFLNAHNCIYTPYLGLANFIAKVQLIGEYEASIVTSEEYPIEIVSPVRIKETMPREFLVLEEGKVYFRERMPAQLKRDRTPEAYSTYLFEPNGKSIRANKGF
ncbi:MAG: type I-B CRISPR-associated protein Cas5, partial [bacterium (Candidatus Stahlbacteria) CG23_combo_of_CG06-09_8_20_14_all_40_9]